MIQLIAYPQGTNFNLGGVIDSTVLDLYNNEPIPLVLNVDDFTNVAENTASYSRPMKLPGTKINNKFFTFIYEVTSNSNFNPHLKTAIILKDNSITIFEGYMQLNDILIKEDVISYDITLYSEAVQLKDTLSNKLITDIDLTELRHEYHEDTVVPSFDTAVGVKLLYPINTSDSFAGALGDTHTQVLRYPICKWNTVPTANATYSIWSFPDGWDGYRPWINCLYLIDNIFRDAGYTYTSNFLNSPSFNKLYNDTNTEIGIAQVEILCTNPNTTKVYNNTWQRIEYGTATANSNFNAANYYDTTNFTYENATTASNNVGIYPNTDIPVVIAGGVTLNILFKYTNMTTGQVWTGSSIPLTNGDILFEAGMGLYGAGGFPGEIIKQEIKCINATGTFTLDGSGQSIFSNSTKVIDFENILVNSDKGDLTQWDYFKAFIDMYKLIIMQDATNPSNLIIEPYRTWVDSGTALHDLTSKVDIKEIKYKPITGLNKKISFTFTEDTPDWITINHNNPNKWQYPYNFTPNIEIFDSKEEIIQVKPFAATYCKALSPEIQIFAPHIVNQDTSLTNWPNAFRVLYDNGTVNIPGSGYINCSGFWPINSSVIYNQFSSTNIYPITSSSEGLNFGTVSYSGWGGGTVLNSLYTLYYGRYIDELYHKDTKIVSILVNLNSSDIANMQFNDTVLIKNKKYRIRKIEYRPGAISKMELLTIKDL